MNKWALISLMGWLIGWGVWAITFGFVTLSQGGNWLTFAASVMIGLGGIGIAIHVWFEEW